MRNCKLVPSAVPFSDDCSTCRCQTINIPWAQVCACVCVCGRQFRHSWVTTIKEACLIVVTPTNYDFQIIWFSLEITSPPFFFLKSNVTMKTQLWVLLALCFCRQSNSVAFINTYNIYFLFQCRHFQDQFMLECSAGARLEQSA